MIKCNRCGNMTPAGPMCQLCGAPLSSKMDAGFSQRTGAQEQSELPAWLESLRVGERPATPAGTPPKFSTADFIDEGPLPIWMRSERAETPDPSNMSMPEHLSAFSDQTPNGGNFPPAGLTAQSLIDEKSLPSWMKENQQPSVPPTGFSASSLLQQDSVPDWMKALQPPNATPSAPSYNGQSGYKEQAGYFEQSAGRAESLSPGPASGFSAHDLIDQQALPTWMAPQGERNAPQAPQAPQTDPTMRPGQTGGMALNQSGLSASSLLDANSLPQWMREGGNDPRTKVEPAQPGWPTQMPPNSNWGAANTPPAWSGGQTPSQPSMQANTTQAPGANLSASSFIDANALPEWLRNAADSRAQAGSQGDRQGGPKQGSYSVPPRVDNVRVPSRPRGSDPNSVESSEVAANVFASMLGVASTAPNYPGQQPGQPGPYQQPQQPGSYQQSNSMGQPGSYQQSNSMGQPGPYQQSNSMGGQSAIPSSPPPNLGVANNSASQSIGGASSYGSVDAFGSMQNMQGYGNSFSGNNANQAGGPSSMGSSYYAGNVVPPSPPVSQVPGVMDDQKNAKKRGLFGAFLDWLSR